MTQDVNGHQQRTAYLADQRWFAGKGREFEVTDVRVVAELPRPDASADGPQVRIELVDVAYSSGIPERETYQMPVSAYGAPQEHLGHALIRHGDGEWTYDAPHDHAAMAALRDAFTAGLTTAGVTFHRTGGHELDPQSRSSFFTGEQSNSSVIFGEDAILKIYRKVHDGPNPDIELHRALTEAGSTHVAALYGWIRDTSGGAERDLAMLQQFLRTASDGWEAALTSARNLLTTQDPLPEQAGGDFGAEAYRLGEAVAEVHAMLADDLGTGTVDARAVADQMRARLDAAVEAVADLDRFREGVDAVFARLADLGEVTCQRIHGDLHLGQTLRTSLGWKLVDFEGEPAKPLADRVLPDSAWRDVAGMVRSFDYAAAASARDLEAVDPEAGARRARAWVDHNVEAFLDGYTAARGVPLSDAEEALLDAYAADKAVYEAGYEARNRPDWLPIPITALERMTGGTA